MLKTRKNTIRNQFEQQWFNVISFQKPRRVYTAIWYQFKNPCAIKKGRFKLSVSTPAKCTSRVGLSKGGQSTNIKKSPKIQNVLRPWNQVLAYKTMLWMSVLRTFAWCFYIMEMSSTHRTTAYHCRHSFFDGSYERFSFRHEWFFNSASLKVRPRTDDKDFLKTPVVFSGFRRRVARIFPEVRSTYSTKSGNLYEAKRTKRGWVSLMVSFWASSPHCFCVFLYTCLLLCFVLFCR